MIRRPPRSTQSRSSAASDVYKRQVKDLLATFRLADNPRDELSWFRLLQLLPGVGPATARKAITALGLPGGDHDGNVLAAWPDAVAVLPPPARMAADVVATALHRSPEESVAVHAERLRSALMPILSDRYDDVDAVSYTHLTLPTIYSV